MSTQQNSALNSPAFLPWYKVPIMWLMISLLSFTVISGIYLFNLAHNTNDTLVVDKKHIPLDKKQAIPSKTNSTKANAL